MAIILNMAAWTVDSLIDQGPEFLRDFIRQPHKADEFSEEFSWLLLADSVAFEVTTLRDQNAGGASKWAEIAADLYEGLIRGSRPQDDLARALWTRDAAHFRALAAGTYPPVALGPTIPEPHRI